MAIMLQSLPNNFIVATIGQSKKEPRLLFNFLKPRCHNTLRIFVYSFLSLLSASVILYTTKKFVL